MAKFKFKGIDKYTESLEKIGPKRSKGIIKYAIYPGADVITDAIRETLEHHRESGALLESIGLSDMRDRFGMIYTKVGFAGYDENHVPNQLKAAVLESGSSHVKGTHCISKTVKAYTDKAIDAMSKALDKKIGEYMED